MKFNALVVAAMVIISVNADWHEKSDKSGSTLPSNPITHIVPTIVISYAHDEELEDELDEEPDDDSDEESAKDDSACESLISAFKGLQEKIRELDSEFQAYQAILSDLKSKMDDVRPEEVEDYMYRKEVCAKLGAIKQESALVKRRTRGFLGEVEAACSKKTLRMMFPNRDDLIIPFRSMRYHKGDMDILG
ncbi:hypothetical protein BASA50_004751 [Batrachochytrium salamandrivorans]|uniref:Uncharacterized protein n=1 Tax=Batrachochytrium salamandrivorans TaxID=1357716 RepID=A0ABQ8FFY5_9FUNG|nr:hypothetical protein BASA60_008917 [Batrachochytrium salamandrivorans]KAH6568507.1 hypothetical protein BASA62_005448 [Batrachochytrium salamandrivorans]KAH6596993.1 hypothetical protein BASA50_004751 [Batrachochytrium salamandrivorans]KAH9245248.1 hypothetical protein BASA81_017274 [Batrachochytrium salamandrivorans]KAH9273463.1 hypothetical protein BASA83_004129 [Batrachochytrium salamandrivorans]